MGKSVETAGRRGWIALIGGGEDKTRDREVLSRIVHLNGARNVAIIPSASRIGGEVGEDYDRAFRSLGVKNRHVLNVTRSSEAADPDDLKIIDEADLIFFTGGDQVRLVETLAGTPLLASVRRRLEEGATVAGTSAGAAAAGRRMLFDGDGRGFDKGSIGTADGFGFLDKVSIDTHFVSRGRLPRLTQFLCRGEAAAGLGLPEDTAVLVSPDRIASVIGRDVVTALSYDHVERNDYSKVDESERFTVDGVRLSFLAPGTRFDLRRWRCVPEGTSKAA
jgi:cyanophycinase